MISLPYFKTQAKLHLSRHINSMEEGELAEEIQWLKNQPPEYSKISEEGIDYLVKERKTFQEKGIQEKINEQIKAKTEKLPEGKTLSQGEVEAAVRAAEWGIGFIDDLVLKHSSAGDFTYNPKTGAISKMKGGGHGQANIDFLETNGLEYNIVKEYDNGVRVGNIPSHKVKAKRTGANQSWFPENWTESDIANAGIYVENLPENRGVADGVAVFGEYNGVRVGIIHTNGRISTIFPDAASQP